MSKKRAKKNLIRIFKTKEFDWVGCRITKKNPLHYHHIFKYVYGEWKELDPKYVLNNGALLTRDAHEYLHFLEQKDRDRYNDINKMLKSLNDTKKAPNREHFDKCKVLRKDISDYYANKDKNRRK